MKLYTFDIAPNPRRIALLMKVKGIDIETEQIPLDGTQFSPEYTAINPRSTVPALVLDDGTVLTEVIGQALYLDALNPEPPLFGSNDLERAQVISWCHRIYLEPFMAIAEVLRNKGKRFADRPLPGPVKMPQIPELVERGLLKLPPFFESFNGHLAGRDFVVGNQLSMADIDLFVVCEFAGWIKFDIPQAHANIAQWRERIGTVLGG